MAKQSKTPSGSVAGPAVASNEEPMVEQKIQPVMEQRPEPVPTQQQDQVVFSPAANLASIATAAQAISNTVDSTLRSQGSGHGLADWALLKCLARVEGPQPMARISVQLGVTRQRAQKQIDVLAEAKLVEVQITDGDKRSRTVMLTQQGQDRLSMIDSLWEAGLVKSEILGKVENLDGFRRRLGRVSWLLGRIQRADAKGPKSIKSGATTTDIATGD